VLLFLPTLLLLLAAYWHRPPLPADFATPRLMRLPQDSGLASFYAWVQHTTSSDAVFILDPRQRVAMCGNIAEFPAMTGRVLFTEDLHHYMVQPYPDARKRFDLAVRLVSGEVPNSTDHAYLMDLKRPLYIVSDQATDSALIEQMHALYGSPVFDTSEVVVFRWPGSEVSHVYERAQ
jgi:hypothetical protein